LFLVILPAIKLYRSLAVQYCCRYYMRNDVKLCSTIVYLKQCCDQIINILSYVNFYDDLGLVHAELGWRLAKVVIGS